MEWSAAVVIQFQNPSALSASHLHARGLEEMASSQSSAPAYNPLGGPSCHARRFASFSAMLSRGMPLKLCDSLLSRCNGCFRNWLTSSDCGTAGACWCRQTLTCRWQLAIEKRCVEEVEWLDRTGFVCGVCCVLSCLWHLDVDIPVHMNTFLSTLVIVCICAGVPLQHPATFCRFSLSGWGWMRFDIRLPAKHSRSCRV